MITVVSTAQKAITHAVDLLCAAGMEVRHRSPTGSYYLAFPCYQGFLRVSDHGGIGRGGPIWSRITIPPGIHTGSIDVKIGRIIATGLGYYIIRAARERMRAEEENDAAPV